MNLPFGGEACAISILLFGNYSHSEASSREITNQQQVCLNVCQRQSLFSWHQSILYSMCLRHILFPGTYRRGKLQSLHSTTNEESFSPKPYPQTTGAQFHEPEDLPLACLLQRILHNKKWHWHFPFRQKSLLIAHWLACCKDRGRYSQKKILQ